MLVIRRDAARAAQHSEETYCALADNEVPRYRLLCLLKATAALKQRNTYRDFVNRLNSFCFAIIRIT